MSNLVYEIPFLILSLNCLAILDGSAVEQFYEVSEGFTKQALILIAA